MYGNASKILYRLLTIKSVSCKLNSQQDAMKKNNLYKAVISTLVFWGLLFSNCTNTTPDKSNDEQKTGKVNQPLSKPGSSYTDTLIITSASAVFFNPDSLQLEKIRSVIGKPVFESMEHDCFYQMRNARTALKSSWPQVRIIETSKARHLVFIKADKSKLHIDLDTKNDMCGILLFNKEKDPVLIDMMNIDTELGFYFKKQ